MLSLTTGGPTTIYSRRGLSGDIGALLFPINHGILHFVGFDVLPPFIAYAATRATPDQRTGYLRAYEERLLNLQDTPAIAYAPLSQYDESFQLKPEVVPATEPPFLASPLLANIYLHWFGVAWRARWNTHYERKSIHNSSWASSSMVRLVRRLQ